MKGASTLLILYVLTMLLAFLVPVPSVSVTEPDHFDKLVHFGIFGGFAFLYDFDRRPSAGRALLASVLFAAGIELLQWVLPYRSGDWWDFAAGAAGAGAGVALARVVRTRAGWGANSAP